MAWRWEGVIDRAWIVENPVPAGVLACAACALLVGVAVGLWRLARALVPAAYDSCALGSAASDGHVDAVRALLADGRASPTAFGSFALRSAAFHGHVDVVRALLADGRASPTEFRSIALSNAAFRGHTGVVRALLADGRVDLAAVDSDALRWAAENGYGHADCLAAAWALVHATARWHRRRRWLRGSTLA
jgi:hypothetical protein